MSTVIRDLWPEDIKYEDVISPEEILNYQAAQLEARTNGLLVGDIVKHVGEDRITLGFEVQARLTDKRVRLFGVQHREEYEYPVAIQPPNEELPDYLKERVYEQSFGDVIGSVARATKPILMATEIATAPGKWVQNEWVASSPEQFTKKVEELLSRPAVKAIVISLLSHARQRMANEEVEE